MRPGPITTSCQPTWAEPEFRLETFDSLNYAKTVERETVPSHRDEHEVFELEVSRLQKLRKEAGPEWEPTTIRLMQGDYEMERKVV